MKGFSISPTSTAHWMPALIAEKSLNAYQRHKYTILVRGTVASVDSMWAMVHATAAQKAEAYLRALNLWKE